MIRILQKNLGERGKDITKKLKIAMAVGTVVFVLSACADGLEEPEENQTDTAGDTVQISDSTDEVQETANDETLEAANLNHATKETKSLDITAGELLDLFVNGEIGAVSSEESASTFYMADLNRDSEEWNSYSIGERVDLDNDGENELVINGPYGGIYLDARGDKVYEFAVSGGTALVLSYTYYNGAVWIMYSNRSSAGFEFYHMEKFEGADHLAAEINFGEELVDPNNAEAGLRYTWNETEISYDEYTELCSKIFAAEVNTN